MVPKLGFTPVTLIPDILETGIDGLNPIEIKVGMDINYLKKNYEERLVLHGGANAVLWDDKEKILDEIKRLMPHMKENDRYIFGGRG